MDLNLLILFSRKGYWWTLWTVSYAAQICLTHNRSNAEAQNRGKTHLFVSNHWKGKGKGKKTSLVGQWPSALRVSVLLTFTEAEHTRQVHPRQTLTTSEEVPLLRPPKFYRSLLASCRKQQCQLCVCVVVSVYVLFAATLCWRVNFICALVTAFSVNILN